MTDDFLIDAPDDVRAAYDELPDLPADMTEVGGVMWLSTAVLKAGRERGWSRDLMRQLLCMMVAGTLAHSSDDDELIIAELRDALLQARAFVATKQ
jgi:hypothetical protein